MKLYLDDIRNPHQSGYKDSEWIVCRNDKTFKDMFESFGSIITLHHHFHRNYQYRGQMVVWLYSG